MNVWYGTAGDELTSLLRAMAKSGRKNIASSKPIDLVEGKDFRMVEDCPGSSVRTEHEISNLGVAGSSPARDAKET